MECLRSKLTCYDRQHHEPRKHIIKPSGPTSIQPLNKYRLQALLTQKYDGPGQRLRTEHRSRGIAHRGPGVRGKEVRTREGVELA